MNAAESSLQNWTHQQSCRAFPGPAAILRWMLLIAGMISGTLPVSAALHPISVTETQVYVSRTQAIVRIQLFAEDLMMFQELEPDDRDILSEEELRRGLQQHRQFLLDKVTLRDAAGQAWEGTVTDLTPFEIPVEGIAVSDLMLHTATYQIEYPFAEPPEYVTLQQDITDQNFIFPSEMRVSIHQAGSDLTFTESLKAGESTTLRFDWDADPLSDEASDAEWEQWFEKQREATLGITSYSSVYSFIYIDPAEVRHEILIPLATLKTILPLRHRDPAFVDMDEQDAVRKLISDWLRDVNPVTINGTRIHPDFTRIDFYGLDLKDFASRAEARPVSLASGRVGIILTYRTPEDAVRDTTITWDRFHSTIRRIQSVVFPYTGQLARFEFSRYNRAEDNQLVWTCPNELLPAPVDPVPVDVPPLPMFRLPLASSVLLLLSTAALMMPAGMMRRITVTALAAAALAGYQLFVVEIPHPWKSPPTFSNEEAADVFRLLHRGTYRALDFGSDDRVYEVLATTVDGSLLEELFLQLRQSLEIRDQGGAVARVRSVDYQRMEKLPRQESPLEWPAFRLRAQWTVAGSVEHWGHVHERQNQFEGTFHVEPRMGSWRITHMEIDGQNQLSQKTSLRKF